MDIAVFTSLGTLIHPTLRHPDYSSFIRNLRHSGLEIDKNGKIRDFLRRLGRDHHHERGKDETWETMHDSFFSSTRFLVEQGLDVNENDDARVTTLMRLILTIDDEGQSAEGIPETVFYMCLLNANVSIRDPKFGYQALHLLLLTEWSAESAPLVMEIAYILIHYGGADVYACDYDDLSASMLAIREGWWEEWETVLNRCGYNPYGVLLSDYERLQKSEKIGDGCSTTVDTDDILEPIGTVTRRKTVNGDRHID